MWLLLPAGVLRVPVHLLRTPQLCLCPVIDEGAQARRFARQQNLAVQLAGKTVPGVDSLPGRVS